MSVRTNGSVLNEYHKHDSPEDPIIANDDNIREIVEREIKRLNNDANLNHIDVSKVTDMSGLFSKLDFTGDIYQWDVGNVIYMSGMFEYSSFDGDISIWNVSKVEDMTDMFKYSKFKGNICHWNVSKVKKHDCCFDDSPLADQPNNQPKFNP